MLLLPSARVQFLVGELTYHQLPGMAKKPKKPQNKKQTNKKKNEKTGSISKVYVLCEF